MFHFRDPGPGVRAALEMVGRYGERRVSAGPRRPHTGPVIFQGGDYFGQTVNISARIAEYARPGEVLVSLAVADASARRRGSRSRTSARSSSRESAVRRTCSGLISPDEAASAVAHFPGCLMQLS